MFRTALTQRCPACHKGKIFSGLALRAKCDGCGLPFTDMEIGDGPAFFALTVLGFVVVGVLGYLEYAVQPDYWIHAVLAIVLCVVLTPLLLRFFKAALLAWQYKVKRLEPQ